MTRIPITTIPITLATAGILGLIYLALTFLVVRYRFLVRVMVGDGAGKPGGDALLVAIRMHGNFSEYVPLSLILLGGIEAAGAARDLVLGLAIALVLGRLLHPFGLRMKAPNPPRAVGAMLTWGVVLVASLTALALAV
jgi:uncharacterized protein